MDALFFGLFTFLYYWGLTLGNIYTWLPGGIGYYDAVFMLLSIELGLVAIFDVLDIRNAELVRRLVFLSLAVTFMLQAKVSHALCYCFTAGISLFGSLEFAYAALVARPMPLVRRVYQGFSTLMMLLALLSITHEEYALLLGHLLGIDMRT